MPKDPKPCRRCGKSGFERCPIEIEHKDFSGVYAGEAWACSSCQRILIDMDQLEDLLEWYSGDDYG